jgi:hypothetical protein
MPRYEVTSRSPRVLEEVAKAGSAVVGHVPERYTAFVDIVTHGRWASVTCVCGNSQREWWLLEDETYLGLIKRAWLVLGCSGAVSDTAEDLRECLSAEDGFF